MMGEAERGGALILAIVESPYAGDIEKNVAYARECMGMLVRQGYAPIASHLLYTQPGVLDDLNPEERALGIAAGLAWRRVAEVSIFCARLGWSRGMLAALASAKQEGRPYVVIHGDEPEEVCDGETAIRHAEF